MTTDRPDAWAEYLAAAQRLDAVRRGAASASAEQDRTLRAAREELAGVRARLVPQRRRLREVGVPAERLYPSPAESQAAAAQVGGGAAGALTALHRARATADAADAALLGGGARGAATWPRNLLVYGPFALVVLVVEVALYLVADRSRVPVPALAWGLAMPALAFGLGWVIIPAVFPSGADGRVDRTALVGLLVCFAPLALVSGGIGALTLLR